MARDALDGVAVGVAGCEFHAGIDGGRVLAQRRVDLRELLDEFAPVHRGQQAQAADAVAHRDLCRGLRLHLQLHQLLDRLVALGQVLLDPGQRQCQRRAAAVQLARQLGDEGRRHRRLRARHVGDEQDQALGHAFGDVAHAVGPQAREVALDQAGRDARGDAAQVLDQRQPQHDGHGPQLAELQRLHRLVRGDEARQRAAAEAAVAMRHRMQREVVDARQAGVLAAGQARQLAAVAGRQMAPGHAHLLLDEVEVVEQPFAGGRDAALLVGAAGELGAGVGQHLLVVAEPAQQPVPRAQRRQLVAGGELPAMLLHLVGGEQLRTQRRLGGAHGCAGGRQTSWEVQPRSQPRDEPEVETVRRVHPILGRSSDDEAAAAAGRAPV
ncbi:MAG: hypothetical protein KGL18_08655 [Burkholderiales bacterium]|nr:hypothetical protein [Burkholderiales bacterium]MDE2158818.1 hypothetical protein [Burkholderiales bacterium]MDE2503028.1 hypothetical protein [Burkholderiales bacterium]